MTRILLLSELPVENVTSGVILRGLRNAYEALGFPVAAVGVHFHRSYRPIRAHRSGRKTADGIACLNIPRMGRDQARYYASLRRAITSLAEQADFVHYHHFFDQFSLLTASIWQAAKKSRIPIGVTFQDYGNPGNESLPKKLNAQNKLLMESFLNDCLWITALSRFSRANIEAAMPRLKGRIRVIPNGYDPDEMRAAIGGSGPAEARRRDWALCVAALSPYKGIDILIKAWKNVRRGERVNRLFLCGDGYKKSDYERLSGRMGLSSRISFLGGISRKKIWPLIKGCSLAVLPSRHESFGMAVVEAFACGKTVVASASGGPQEIIRHRVNGLLVPPGDPHALSDAVLELIRAPRMRRRLERAALASARKYRWDNIAARYLRLPRAHEPAAPR